MFRNKINRIFYFALLLMVLGFSVACNPSKKISKTSTTAEDADSYQSYSKIFGVEFSGKEDKKLLKELSSWIGVKYVYGGVSKTTGTDCSGFVQTVYKTVYNVSLNRTAYDQEKNCDSVSKSNLKFGDLIFFKINSTKISHVGIYLVKNKFIHASSKGVMVSDLTEAYYTKYYYSGGRVKK